jgi:hypothetical protein
LSADQAAGVVDEKTLELRDLSEQSLKNQWNRVTNAVGNEFQGLRDHGGDVGHERSENLAPLIG